MALFVWTATTFPTATEQGPLTIDYNLYESNGEHANVFVKTVEDKNLYSYVNHTVNVWNEKQTIKITDVSENLADVLVQETKKVRTIFRKILLNACL